MTKNTPSRHLPKSVTRRDVMKYTLAGAGLTALGSLSRALVTPVSGAPLTGHKRLVVIYCYGGYDGMNMVVPMYSSAYYTQRPTLGITDAHNPLDLNGVTGMKLHPEFTGFQSIFNNDGKGAVFHMVGYPTGSRSHFTSQDIYSLGVDGDFTPLGIDESGWMARFADAHAPSATGAVAVGVGRPMDVEGGAGTPLILGSVSSFKFLRYWGSDNDQLHRMNTVQNVLNGFAGSSGATSETTNAIDQGITLADQLQAALGSYNTPFMDSYPVQIGRTYLSRPGRHLRDIAMMIQAGFDTRVFFTGMGGWDTHGNQGITNARQQDLIHYLDKGIENFVNDLKHMGVYDDTMILVVSEFGRTNKENDSGGTDHGKANTFFAAGGGTQSGEYGVRPTDTEILSGADGVGGPNWLNAYSLDFRDIYREAIQDHMGFDAGVVFPEPQTINTNIGFVA